MRNLPKWDEAITFACAICDRSITVKYRGRAPSAFCRSCTSKLRDQARQIREAVGRGVARTEILREYGISRKRFWRLVRGETFQGAGA